MNNYVAISVKDINKTFKLPHEKNNSIKSSIVNFYKSNKTYEKQVALKNISFEVKKGEFFGIVGKNGSGKSTLLKLLAGIYVPDSGNVTIDGKIIPFIELGVGFNPELTGRENIFLNGALLGFSRKEMLELYQEIVDFAEVERFMDQKLKNYSSGMQVRLAFSIAIRAVRSENDILILDEVLAVGDEAFQRKCLDVFEQYKARRQTVVLVTHDMTTVRNFCSRAVLLNNSVIIEDGEPNKIASKYSKLNNESIDEDIKRGIEGNQASILKIETLDEFGKNKKNSFKSGEKMTIRLSWPSGNKKILNAGISIVKLSGEYIFGTNTNNEKYKLEKKDNIQFEVSLDIGPGKYFIMAGLFGTSDRNMIEFTDRGPEFMIIDSQDPNVLGITRLNHRWKQ
ncbi:MAG: ABC transporter ATP-binding protein [Bacteroidota bacterium]